MRIFLIDDEQALSSSISEKLKKTGYKVTAVHSYNEFKKHKQKECDLYIVDISLGDGSGLDVIREVREERDTPIIIISGHRNINIKIEGLDIGADDYLVKPFHPDELLARIRTVVRRKNDISQSSEIRYKDIIFDIGTRKIMKGDEEITLTKKEKQFVEFFLTHKGKLISKRKIVEALWGDKKKVTVTDNTINVTIYKIRQKLGDDFELETRIGEGYILHK